MSKNKIALICGIVLILFQFTGFPHYVNTTVYSVIGVIFIFFAISSHIRRRTREFELIEEHPDQSYAEHSGPERATIQEEPIRSVS